MALKYQEGFSDDGFNDPALDRFESLHSVHTVTGDHKHLITLSGIVRIDFQGTSSKEWRVEDISIIPKIIYIPQYKALKVEHWAPFVSINSIFNKETANNAGWGVDSFGCVFSSSERLIHFRHPYVEMRNRISVRDNDGWILKVGYHLTLSGIFVDWDSSGDDELNPE